MKLSKLHPGEIVKSNGVYGFRKYQKEKYADFSNLDVFFDFKTVGNIDAGTGFTLENQGTMEGVTFTPTNIHCVSIEEGVGAKLLHGDTWYHGNLYLKGVKNLLANGSKTIAFRITESVFKTSENARILAIQGTGSALLGIGAPDGNLPFHIYARGTSSGKYFYASAVDKDYSINGSHLAWKGGNKECNNKNIIITMGSSTEPSTIKIYIDGSLAGIFDISGTGSPTGYMNLYKENTPITCFGETGTYSQSFASATVSYFAMTQGEMSAEEVAEFNERLNAIA